MTEHKTLLIVSDVVLTNPVNYIITDFANKLIKAKEESRQLDYTIDLDDAIKMTITYCHLEGLEISAQTLHEFIVTANGDPNKLADSILLHVF